MSKMNSKIIVFLAVWVLAALGLGAKLPREADAAEDYGLAVKARADNLNIRGANDSPFLAKFNQLLGRADTVTTTVTMEICQPGSGTTPPAGATTGTAGAPTTSVSTLPAPTTPNAPPTSSSSELAPSGHAPIPSHTSLGPSSSGTVASTTSEASKSSGAPTSETSSGVSATGTSTASTTYSHAPVPSGTATPNGASYNEGMPGAVLAMAVAILALVTL